MATLVVPAEVETVFQQVRTCEFTTLAKDGTPITWPTVALVQGEAVCPDQIVTQSDELDTLGRLVMVRQPISARYAAIPLTRWLMDWYMMRLLLYVTPRRIR